LLGGGAAFGLLATSPQPMVGASGAIFGLAAAWVLVWLGTIRAGGAGWTGLALRAAGAVALMVAVNVAMWLWQDGRLAWEAHLGGFVAGGAMAALLGRGPSERAAR
jgi:membrane associated rhomboid family serine protease